MSSTEAAIAAQPPAADTSSVNKKTDVPSAPMDAFKRLSAAVEALDLPDSQKAVVMKLKDYQEAHLKFEEEYRREWNALKLKYLAKFRPLYESRRQALTKGDEAEAAGEPVTTGTRNIPGFWLQAMKNHMLLAEMIEAHDSPILAYLEDIVFEWVDPLEQTSFRLDFCFAPNEFFKNRVLTKTYHLVRAEDDDEESVLTKTEGTPVEWYPDKTVTEKTVTRKQRNKRTNQTRMITEVVEENSFFNFFQSHEIPAEEELDSMPEADITELEMIVEAEFEVGSILRDKIIPRALGWYLGIEKDEEAESAGGEDGADFDEDEEEEDDEEENEE